MTVVLFATLVLKVVDFLRLLANLRTNVSAVVTQLCAWGGGILLVYIGTVATVTKGVVLPGVDQPLGALNAGSIILVGMLASSLASTIVDVKQALDSSDTSMKPSLVARAVKRSN